MNSETSMQTTEAVAAKLTEKSKRQFYDVTTKIHWSEELDQSKWMMSPELVSIYGTELWDSLDESAQRNLAFFETAGFFSLILHGERPLLEGMSHRMYTLEKSLTVNEYLHHFVDEENKHMMMFSTYLRRYVGKVYPEKKIPFQKDTAPGEDDIAFFAKVLVVEELSDYYNVVMAKDERLDEVVRAVNHTHHVDEARHIHFGRQYLKQLWDKISPTWSEEQLQSFRSWLIDYVNASWRDFYNPSVYKDAGLPDPYLARKTAIESDVCRKHRQTSSAKFLKNLVRSGVLLEVPALK